VERGKWRKEEGRAVSGKLKEQKRRAKIGKGKGRKPESEKRNRKKKRNKKKKKIDGRKVVGEARKGWEIT
jgi:hypothetical protein